MSTTLQLEYEDDLCALYTWRALVVVIWRKAPTAATIRRPAATLFRALERPGHPVVFAALAPPQLLLPDSDARKALHDVIRAMDAHLAGAVSVVLGSGFQAAAVRAMLSGFALLARQKHPVAFVGTTAAAAEFVVGHWPAAAAPAPLKALVATALAEVVPR